MLINKQVLHDLRPCTERYKNFLENYSDFEGDFKDFLSLDKITYDDKIWVSKKILSREVLFYWATLCAESVLYIFENKYPKDKRLRKCIEYLKIGDFSDKEKLINHKNSSDVYAADAYAAYAADAVYSAAAAAASVYDADAVAYAAYAAAAAAAANAAVAAKIGRKEKNIKFLIEAIKLKGE